MSELTTRKLTDKQQKFIQEYVIDLNGTQAAIRAGYSLKSAKVQAYKNLRLPYIRSAIDDFLEQNAMSAIEVLARLAAMARSSITDVIIVDDETFKIDTEKLEQNAHLIKSIQHTQHGIKIDLHDAQSALVHLGKAHALFRNVQEINATVRNADRIDYSKLTSEELDTLEAILEKAQLD